jgi:hypothetical protein
LFGLVRPAARTANDQQPQRHTEHNERVRQDVRFSAGWGFCGFFAALREHYGGVSPYGQRHDRADDPRGNPRTKLSRSLPNLREALHLHFPNQGRNVTEKFRLAALKSVAGIREH